MAAPGRDLEAKIVVLGAQGVGKTALLTRYISSSFEAKAHPTIGANFLIKRLLSTDTNPPTSIKLQIWDTAGQERFRSISKLYYRGANAALICYDITDERSFLEMGSWLEELRENLGQDCLLHVVGTKADVAAEVPNARQVPFERCIQYVSEHLNGGKAPKSSSVSGASVARTTSGSASATSPQTPSVDPRSSGFWGSDSGFDSCHEISSKDGDGVEEVFRVLIRKLVEQQNQKERQLEFERQKSAQISSVGTAGDRGDPHVNGRGSFRLGLGDKRRSWLGFPASPVTDAGAGKGGRCC